MKEWETLAGRVRWGRERRGWGQQEIADRLGWIRTTISDWETGRTKRPKRDKIRALADLLGVDTDWLASGVGIPLHSPRPPLETGQGSSDTAQLIQAAMTLLARALQLQTADAAKALAALAAVEQVKRKPGARGA